MDLTETIAPRSDQQNFDDFAQGPRTVTVERVTAGTAEQPVDIHLVEYPGRPYKPSKSMRRILVTAWGAEASQYTGRRMTLVGDPNVTFGKDRVGGIKISHLSHIDKRLVVSLTVTKGKRAPHTVDPLPDVAPKAKHPLVAAFEAAGITDNAQRLDYCRTVTGRDLKSAADMTDDERAQVISELQVGTGEPA
jgi:hypothetical protein